MKKDTGGKRQWQRALVVAALALQTACLGGAPEATSEALRGERQTIVDYERDFEPTPTLIGPRAAMARQIETTDLNLGDAATVVDAREGRTVFPVPQQVRTFADDAALTSFVAAELGVDSIQLDDRGSPQGWMGSYAMLGAAYWTDARTGVRYRIADPMAAYLGGVTGEIRVGHELRCLDPDGRCSAGERASYLEPEGELTKPTHVTVPGSSGVSALFHSFYNKTYFPWFWARHGSNSGINVAPLPSTQVSAAGDCYWFSGVVGWVPYPFPSMSGTNVQSIETAVWTAAPGNAIFDALASCGRGVVTDPDVQTPIIYTGNGPNNNDACGI